jgi:hypothetical protein
MQGLAVGGVGWAGVVEHLGLDMAFGDSCWARPRAGMAVARGGQRRAAGHETGGRKPAWVRREILSRGEALEGRGRALIAGI